MLVSGVQILFPQRFMQSHTSTFPCWHRILVLLDYSDVQFTCPRSTRPPKWTACSSPPPILFFLKKSGIHFSILFLSSPNPTEEVIPQAFPSVLSTSPDDGGGPED